MKKIFALLLALMLLTGAALADASEGFNLWFEDGFSLSIPEDWVMYPVDEATADDGVRYILGDGAGERYMYIRSQATDLADIYALRAAIDGRGDSSKTSELNLNGQPFASFILRGENASGCATIYNGELLTFLFTPQGDSDYMLQVAEIMASFSGSAR